MASIRKVIPVGAGSQEAWEALADFDAVHERVAAGFVTAVRLDGGDRVVTFANGAEAQERLVSADGEARRLVYTVVRSDLGFTHHQASVEVVDGGDGTGGCRLVWITDALPDEVAPIVDGLMDAGAAAIARTLAG
ncbi:MAG TPA: SRPBCC family protein [Acidimicrobiales bacterium]|nr:SRPBCC family protein [Acidimicrobiales bacterium]